jgi:integrase
VIVQRLKPRFVLAKTLPSGVTAFYFNVPKRDLAKGCPNLNQALGTDYVDACGVDGKGGRAAALNARYDEWQMVAAGIPLESHVQLGTVDWLFRTYKTAKAYLEKVSPRSRTDYERTMHLVADTLTNKGERVGSRMVKAISPQGADKIYERIIGLMDGEGEPTRLRQGEKAVKLCSKAWRVVRRLYPAEFDKTNPDPWAGVTLKRRIKKTKAAVTREQVYKFAWGCIERGRPEPAAAAVICFEWLQRPENVLAGEIRWSDYRTNDKPGQIRIEHHKTGKFVLHPLEEWTDGGRVLFYEEAEKVLAHLPRRGAPMILREIKPPKSRPNDPIIYERFSFSGFQKIVQTMREKIGLPSHFTLDACRHGGMTELEEAELTDGQGRALSAHSSKAYDGYAKRTEKRVLGATRKRFEHIAASRS